MQDNTLIEAYETIIESVGEDRHGLKDTPRRAAEAMQFLTQGYSLDINEVVNDALFPTTSNEMVIVKNIELYSLCEHHLLPFIGKCHVAYLPSGTVIGLSKVARIIDVFARRLQIQEHLTQQIAETIQEITSAKGVGVIIESQHMCMMMRGVEKQNSVMTTSCMLGAFRDKQSTRTEFLSLIN
ncbi:MAG: GTP cyclohydrolase I FolE [Gammaproteobacteria bacterium]